MIATDYPFLDVFWSILIFFLWVAWIWILIAILTDVFRRHDLSGAAKAAWTIFVVFLPFLGVLVYMISQSKGMAERSAQQQRAYRAEADDYIRSVASADDPAGQIAKAKQLLDSGAITQDEFDTLKRKALAA